MKAPHVSLPGKQDHALSTKTKAQKLLARQRPNNEEFFERENNDYFYFLTDSLQAVKGNPSNALSQEAIRSLIGASVRRMIRPNLHVTTIRAHSLMQKKLGFVLTHLEEQCFEQALEMIDHMLENLNHIVHLSGSKRSRVAQNMLSDPSPLM